MPAAAEDEGRLARARGTFQQGIELEQAGNWSAAVQRFREVGQVRMTPQVRFHIALCEDRLGKLVGALGGYELALADADSVGPEFRAEVEANIRRLRERIPHLTLQRGSGAEAASVSLDSVSLGNSSIGVEVPVDPGPHAVSAQAPGYEPFEATVTLGEGERQTLEIVLVPREEPAPAPGQKTPTQPVRRFKMVPYILGGAGAVSLLSSGVLLAFRQSTANQLEDACGDSVCPTSERDDYSRLKTYHYATLVTAGVGVAALGTGVVLYILDHRSDRKEQSAFSVRPLQPSVAGATLHVQF